jgi:hypothetical protein
MLGPISLWFQRKNTGDFHVTIRLTDDGFVVSVHDKYASDDYTSMIYLDSFEAVTDYVSTLCYQVLNDRDEQHAFTHFQYTVPNFPSVLMKVSELADDDVYQRFVDAMAFHFL